MAVNRLLALTFVFLLITSLGFTQTGPHVTQMSTFENMAALRLAVGQLNGQWAEIRGYYTANDGGGGTFYWDATSAAGDNLGTVILPTGHATAGRWVRRFSPPVDVKWFGAKGDGTTDDRAAIQAAIDAYGGTYAILFSKPTSKYMIKSSHPTQTSAGLWVYAHHTKLIGDRHPTGWESEILVEGSFTATPTALIEFTDATGVDAQLRGIVIDGIGFKARGLSYVAYLGTAPKLTVSNSAFYGGRSAGRSAVTFHIQQSWVSRFDNVLFDGGDAGIEVGIATSTNLANTSINFTGCYAANNDAVGFHFRNLRYSSMTSCAADCNGTAYYFDRSDTGTNGRGCSVAMIKCGAEENDTVVRAISSRISIDGLEAIGSGDYVIRADSFTVGQHYIDVHRLDVNTPTNWTSVFYVPDGIPNVIRVIDPRWGSKDMIGQARQYGGVYFASERGGYIINLVNAGISSDTLTIPFAEDTGVSYVQREVDIAGVGMSADSVDSGSLAVFEGTVTVSHKYTGLLESATLVGGSRNITGVATGTVSVDGVTRGAVVITLADTYPERVTVEIKGYRATSSRGGLMHQNMTFK